MKARPWAREGHNGRGISTALNWTPDVGRFELRGQPVSLKRCIELNGLIQPIENAAMLDRLEQKSKRYNEALLLLSRR